MANDRAFDSADVSAGDDILASQYNNLRLDVSRTLWISATPPDSPEEGLMWYDTVNHQLRLYRYGSWDIIA